MKSFESHIFRLEAIIKGVLDPEEARSDREIHTFNTVDFYSFRYPWMHTKRSRPTTNLMIFYERAGWEG